jgi:hypothetical protein
MAEEKAEKGNKGVIAGLGITAAALAAVLLGTRGAGAAPPPGNGTVVTPDAATTQALLALLEHSENIDLDMDQALSLIDALQQAVSNLAVVIQALLGTGGTGALKNPTTVVAWRTTCPAVNTPVRLAARIVPYGMEFVIKALPTNAGVIQVASSSAAAQNPNDSYPLIANEAIMYKIYDTQNIWVCATTAGDGVACTVEQEV